jgi:hypothetical protein
MGRIAAHAQVKLVEATSQSVNRVGEEAVRKACGVLMAMLSGKSWAPHPSNRSAENVGTTPDLPSLRPARRAAGRLVVSRQPRGGAESS